MNIITILGCALIYLAICEAALTVIALIRKGQRA